MQPSLQLPAVIGNTTSWCSPPCAWHGQQALSRRCCNSCICALLLSVRSCSSCSARPISVSFSNAARLSQLARRVTASRCRSRGAGPRDWLPASTAGAGSSYSPKSRPSLKCMSRKGWLGPLRWRLRCGDASNAVAAPGKTMRSS